MVNFQRKERYGWEDLLTIMHLLRAPGGCPWDREQTHQSIRRNFLEETYEALDVTSQLGTDELIAHQNEKVSFKGMTVAASNDAGAPFLYNWDGSGSEGDDLYFNVMLDDSIYTFVVESYLCGPGSDVYEAVKALNVGDVVDMEGFLYWYEGVNPHITSVVKAAA